MLSLLRKFPTQFPYSDSQGRVSNSEAPSSSFILHFPQVLLWFFISLVFWPRQHNLNKAKTRERSWKPLECYHPFALWMCPPAGLFLLGQEREKLIQAYRTYRFEWQAEQIYSVQYLHSQRDQPIKKRLLERWRPLSSFLERWNQESEEKALGCNKSQKYWTWNWIGKTFTHGVDCGSLPAALGSSCKACYPLWLHTFSGCQCYFVQCGFPLGSPCSGPGRGEQAEFTPLFLFSSLLSSKFILSTAIILWLKTSW